MSPAQLYLLKQKQLRGNILKLWPEIVFIKVKLKSAIMEFQLSGYKQHDFSPIYHDYQGNSKTGVKLLNCYHITEETRTVSQSSEGYPH